MPTTYRPGSRFHPTELGLVKRYLKNMVEKDISGFIKTLNVYGDAPWLLDHDMNPLYCRNEWYYFVPRTIRGVKTVSRMVPGNGESFLGGTWKSIGKRKDIKKKDELMGYKRELVFNKNVVGKSEKEKTDWHMDEYSLDKNGDEYHDLVLCHVRLLNSDERFRPHVPAAPHVDESNGNNVLPNQEQQEYGFSMLENKYGDVNQHQQREEEQEDSLIPLHPPLQSNHNQRQYLLEDIVYYQNDMMMLENGRGNFNQQQDQEHYPLEGIAFDGGDDNDMFDIDELLGPLSPLQSNDNHGQCPSWDTLSDVPPRVENKDNDNTDDVKQHQQQQDQEQQRTDLPNLLLDPEWDDLFDGAEDLIMKNMDEGMKQRLQEVEEELTKLMQPVPQPQDSGVHADQVMPKKIDTINNSRSFICNSFIS